MLMLQEGVGISSAVMVVVRDSSLLRSSCPIISRVESVSDRIVVRNSVEGSRWVVEVFAC